MPARCRQGIRRGELGPTAQRARSGPPRLAILWDPKEPLKASNDEALQRFLRAAPLVGLEAELICHDALERLPEFDALFSRASPEVTGLTYEFVRRAEALGMPVVDDPESILKCVNKVYMHELMSRHRIAQPRTLIVHRGNVEDVVPTLGLPCVLKLPDSGFGLDVVKLESEESLREAAERFFKVSELIVAQEWLPTSFDWRVGVFDRRPLFVCKYFMAPGHWKILQMADGRADRGRVGDDVGRRGAGAGGRDGGARRKPGRERPLRSGPEAGRETAAT
jgi:glutathione synthase/RimK-type ligase-like ATP-grasp enzyme